MNNQTFNSLLENRITKTREVLGAKAGEYASEDDRLHNFKVAARFSATQITPEEALVGMWRKHLVSVLDIVDGITKGAKEGLPLPSATLVDEKISDSINYIILLEALIHERRVSEELWSRVEQCRTFAGGAPYGKFEPKGFGIIKAGE